MGERVEDELVQDAADEPRPREQVPAVQADDAAEVDAEARKREREDADGEREAAAEPLANAALDEHERREAERQAGRGDRDERGVAEDGRSTVWSAGSMWIRSVTRYGALGKKTSQRASSGSCSAERRRADVVERERGDERDPGEREVPEQVVEVAAPGRDPVGEDKATAIALVTTQSRQTAVAARVPGYRRGLAGAFGTCPSGRDGHGPRATIRPSREERRHKDFEGLSPGNV